MGSTGIEVALDEGSVKRMHRLAQACAGAALLIGLLLLVGWATGSDLLKAFLPGHIAAKPNSAVGIMLAASALLLEACRARWARHLSRVLACLVGALGAVTCLEWITGWDAGIDQLLFVEAKGALETAVPGRMAIVTSLKLMLLAWVMLDRRRWSPWLPTVGMSISMVALLGYSFGAHALYSFGTSTRISLPVALSMCLLFLSVLLGREPAGWVAAMASRNAGGAMLRRAVPFAILAPWLLGWLAITGSRAGLCSYNTDQVVTVAPLILISLLLLFQWGRTMDALDQGEHERRREAEGRSQELEARVLERTGALLLANEANRLSELRYRSLVEATAQIVWTTDADGQVLTDMPTWRAFTGQSVEETRGWGWLDSLHPDDRARTAEAWKQAVGSGSGYDTEYRIRRHDGEYRHVWVRGVPVVNEDGSVREWVGTSTDITDRKHAELDLRRLNRALKALNHCTEALVRARDEHSLLQQVCDIIVQVGGYPLCWAGYAEDDGEKTVRPVAVSGLGVDYVRNARITWADNERGRGPTGTAIRTGEPCYIGDVAEDPRFTPWQKTAARHGYASVLAVPLTESRRSFGALNIYAPELNAFDAEERSLMVELASNLSQGILAFRMREERDRIDLELRRLNDSLERRVAERTSDLATAIRDLESFTYSVSHDLRAPLRHIDGFSKVLLDSYSEVLDEQGRHYLDRVRQGTQRMGKLIDDLLNLSRVGRNELRCEPTDLTQMVAEVVDEVRPEAGSRNVEWHLAGLPPAVCDAGLVRQVFFNLLSNAVKFTRGRDPAIIEVGTAGGEFFVRDNGVGFDPAYADKLFGMFQRLHRPEDFEGTGIGLATVRRILRKHGGDIRAESESGRGTTFYFTISARKVAGASQTEVLHAA